MSMHADETGMQMRALKNLSCRHGIDVLLILHGPVQEPLSLFFMLISILVADNNESITTTCMASAGLFSSSGWTSSSFFLH